MVHTPGASPEITPEQQQAIRDTIDDLILNGFGQILGIIIEIGLDGIIENVDRKIEQRQFNSFEEFLILMDYVKDILIHSDDFSQEIQKDIETIRSTQTLVGLEYQEEILNYLEKKINQGYGFILYGMMLLPILSLPNLDEYIVKLRFTDTLQFQEFCHVFERAIQTGESLNNNLHTQVFEELRDIHHKTAQTVEEMRDLTDAILRGVGNIQEILKEHEVGKIYRSVSGYIDIENSTFVQNAFKKIVFEQELNIAEALFIKQKVVSPLQVKIGEIYQKFVHDIENHENQRWKAGLTLLKSNVEELLEIRDLLSKSGFHLDIPEKLIKIAELPNLNIKNGT